MKKIALSFVLLTACSPCWDDVPGSVVTPVGRPGWHETVEEAVFRWNTELWDRYQCEEPFVVGEGGHSITLVPIDEWSHDGYIGWTFSGPTGGGGYIDIKDTHPDETPWNWYMAIIAHEFGHAMGLEHNDDRRSIMFHSPREEVVFRDEDFQRAAKSIGCI